MKNRILLLLTLVLLLPTLVNAKDKVKVYYLRLEDVLIA